MGKIIQWIKSHLVLVICGALGVLSLTGLVLGVILPDAKTQLEQNTQVLSSLKSAAARPANQQTIEDLRREQLDLRRSIERFLADASKVAPRTLLHNEVFPAVKEGERWAPNEFRNRTAAKRRELLAMLNAKDAPTQDEVEDYRQEMLRAKQREMLQEGRTPATSGYLINPLAGPDDRRTSRAQTTTDSLEDLPPEERVKQDAKAGASIRRAHEVYCYATEEALDARNQIEVKDPPVELMWESQLSLWIQEDIIEALARINNEAAEALPEQNRWVAHMPIKHLLYIAVGPMVSAADAGAGGSAASRMPRGGGSMSAPNLEAPVPPEYAPDQTLTNRGGDDSRDVIHLAVGLVIEADAMLRILDEISKLGFYTPLMVNYEVVDFNGDYYGYIYGSGPLLRVRMEFEHCILRGKTIVRPAPPETGQLAYLDLMPETIKTGEYKSDTSGRSAGPPRPGASPGPGRGGPPGRPGFREPPMGGWNRGGS